MTRPEHSDSPPDPLVGDELIRVSLEIDGLHFQFSTATLVLKADFCLRLPDHSEATVCIENRTGDLNSAWRLLTRRLTRVSLDNIAVFAFDDGTEIIVPSGSSRGEILTGTDGWDSF